MTRSLTNFFFLLLGILFSFTQVHSQNISGTVNDYAPVLSIAGNAVTLNSTNNFAVGDRIMMLQMKGATINQTNSPSYGDVTSLNDAGNYEFSQIDSIGGNVVYLTAPLCNTYTPSAFTQMIRVPVYPNPTVTAPLTGQPWNGLLGGVIVLETPGTLTLNADIVADGIGFLGGAFQSGSFSCADAAYFSAVGFGGEKGEGIVNYVGNQRCSRGKLANGGGGSNRGNSGGGGGGNGGDGGLGGTIYNGCGASTIQGVGGTTLAQSSDKAFLGGGGGGGFRDNGQACTSGESGGGLVIILANAIAGNGYSILARGNDQNLVANDEGAGGGGAGGSVFLFTSNFTSNLTVNTSGGKGGDTFNNIFTGNCHGPGGGGGGGVLWLQPAALPANVTHTSNGGPSGLVTNPNQPCFNTSFQGTNGSGGQTLYNLNPPSVASVPSLGNDTTICTGNSLQLDAGAGYVSYLWSDGSTGQTLTVNATGQYWVEAASTCGSGRDTINVTVANGLAPSLGNDTTICNGSSLVLSPGVFTGYQWQDGSTNSTYTVTTTGQYEVTVSDPSGCPGADTIQVTVAPNPVVNLGGDFSLCAGSDSVLDAGAGFTGYLWQDGSANQTFTVTASGQYEVTVTNATGCQASDTVVATVFPNPVVNLGSNFTLCAGEDSLLDAGPGATAYLWQDGSTNSTLLVNASGQYEVTVTGQGGCQTADTILVTVVPNPVVNLGGDFTLCAGSDSVLDAGAGLTGYLWQDGSTNQTFTVTASGQYEVTVTNADGCQASDTVVATVFPNPVVNLGNDFTLCAGDDSLLDAGAGATSYLWQDGSTNSTLLVNATGLYEVTVTGQGGCQSTDAIQVTVAPLPTVSLGPDFVLCVGNTTVLDAGNGFSAYLWQDGSTNQTFTVNQAGNYAVTVTDGNGCQANDAVNVTLGSASVNLGNDTSICAGSSVLFSTGGGFASYQWSDGSTGSFLVASAAGAYSVTVTDADGCTATDMVSILTVGTYPVVNLGPDTVLCAGTSVTLDAGPADSHSWTTGATSQTIVVPASVGLYVVTATNFPGCSSSDDFRVLDVLPQPTVANLSDVTLCAGDSAVLDAGPVAVGESYLWSDGSTGPTLTVFDEGTYTVTVTNSCGVLQAAASVPPLLTLPSPFIGPDTAICEESIELSALTNADAYLWNGSSAVTFLTVYDAGTYWVEATNQCGSASDTIFIREECEPVLFFPNAFSPNEDQRNDFFLPGGEGVEDYEISIFDRWGKLVFQTQNRFDGWDGKFGGQPVPEGVYVYRVRYSYLFRGQTKELDRQGTITLIR